MSTQLAGVDPHLCRHHVRDEPGSAIRSAADGDHAAGDRWVLREHDLVWAIRLLRRATLGISFVTDNLQMLEQLSPWESQDVRRVLGHGSGFDSPGFRRVREVSPPLGQAFTELLREAGLTIVELHQRNRDYEELYQVAELLTDWDERLTLWRVRHFKVVERIIGFDSVGTQGTPVEVLGRLVQTVVFPELWEVRNELTARSKAESS